MHFNQKKWIHSENIHAFMLSNVTVRLYLNSTVRIRNVHIGLLSMAIGYIYLIYVYLCNFKTSAIFIPLRFFIFHTLLNRHFMSPRICAFINFPLNHTTVQKYFLFFLQWTWHTNTHSPNIPSIWEALSEESLNCTNKIKFQITSLCLKKRYRTQHSLRSINILSTLHIERFKVWKTILHVNCTVKKKNRSKFSKCIAINISQCIDNELILTMLSQSLWVQSTFNCDIPILAVRYCYIIQPSQSLNI